MNELTSRAAALKERAASLKSPAALVLKPALALEMVEELSELMIDMAKRIDALTPYLDDGGE
ncbi:hypothetical protein KBY28_07725 [Ruegeria pomeroyi]|uniref:hypothetical protein n=1 Tax=Ruegeria pomeroyi TaxID=89184 RepID=UPI001F1AB315|nr:hypothetical protein [Ruegeria pomeroyi]MCE8508338.1 hypothetical protein [Ruegeria pomeroyi]